MFTGIIEEVGKVNSISSDKITINCSKVLDEIQLGDSISVNGVCLTVTNFGTDYFTADISKETIKVTNLSDTKSGDFVNLERALTLSSRLGGHIVTGHIDTVGKISGLVNSGEFYELNIKFDKSFCKYVAKKGSVSVNGISLTVADCTEDSLKIAIIPHTYNTTALRFLNSGDSVNLEFDILAKYVEKNLLSSNNSSITADFLAENGFV